MGEWMEAYIEGKDAEWDAGYRGGSGEGYIPSTDDYERWDWKDGDLPDYFKIVKPIKKSCYGCKNHGFITNCCRLTFILHGGAWSHTCNKYEKSDYYEPNMIWCMLWPCWRRFYSGSSLGYKKWMKTDEGAKYYRLAKEYLKKKGIL